MPLASTTPVITFGSLPAPGASPTLAAAGRDDDAPTPALFAAASQRAVKQAIVKSPATPDDIAFRPVAFTKSAGSTFATPEVPIATGVSPVAAVGANARQAQRHVPAWNRVHRAIEAKAPVAYKQVKSLQSMPGIADQPAWAKTPFLLLKGLCESKGWQLTHRKATEGRIGEFVSVSMTVVLPGSPGDPSGGRTFTAAENASGAWRGRTLRCGDWFS